MQPKPTSHPPPRPLPYVLLFLGCVLLGQGARSLESVARATSSECDAGATGELVEVRRLEGSGDLEAERATWQEHVRLSTDDHWNSHGIVLTDSTLPTEHLSLVPLTLDLETGP